MISPVKIWRRQKEIRKLLGKNGKIISWTKIFTTSNEFKKYAPYYSVLIEFSDHQKAFGQLVDVKEKQVKIGLPVKAVLRKVRTVDKDEVIAYGLKFEPC